MVDEVTGLCDVVVELEESKGFSKLETLGRSLSNVGFSYHSGDSIILDGLVRAEVTGPK